MVGNAWCTHFNDLIGRTEFLEVLPGITAKQQKMNLAPLLSQGWGC